MSVYSFSKGCTSDISGGPDENTSDEDVFEFYLDEDCHVDPVTFYFGTAGPGP